MAIKINFDASGNPEEPTLVLSNRSGNKIGQLNAKGIHIKGSQNNPSEISFDVYKYVDRRKDSLWDKIRNFKLVWCKEWNTWFEITVEISEERTMNAKKTVYCKQLGQVELSNTKLHNIEINTENDIARNDYVIPTILYNAEHPEASLLHRLLEKTPHYSVAHVDSSIAKIQRIFSFDDITIYDALQEIAQEIGCLFVFPSNTDKSGHINRTIEVYDLEANCSDCGNRGEFSNICPKCGSKNIHEGYGDDTTIFVTADELAESDIQFTTDTNSVKNCFKLEAGDDLMTATIRNCNPNGSDYIWYLTNDVKDDMSDELVEKLDLYDRKYDYFQKEYVADINADAIAQYNRLAAKYQGYKTDLKTIAAPIIGYPALMTAYYNTIDLAVYLQSALMPDVSMSDTNAESQAALLTSSNLSPIAVTNLNGLSLATANNALLGMAKAIVDSRYQVKVNASGLSNNVWIGNFVVTSYSDEEDTAVSQEATVYITDDYETYVKQKLEKSLAKGNSEDVSISGLFKKDYSSFCAELKKYSLNYLKNFHGACQSCIDILIEQGIADSETWYGSGEDLYNVMYVPYYEKLNAIENEIKVRQNELDIVLGIYDADGSLLSSGMQTCIVDIKNSIQEQLDFQKYLGGDLWLEFCTYRREDKFSNNNYISDGLNNAELFQNALEFLQTASNEIYKSAELQHSISTTLKNLLVIDKFKPLVQHFEVGNWIRVRVDEDVYKLRLIEYEIDYSSLSSISVGFSDVLKVVDGVSDLRDVVSRVNTMAASYDSVQKQASQGFKGSNTVNDWVENGLDATNTMIIGGADHQTQTWDEHGMLFKRYNDITNSYFDTQLKIINSTISITDNNWETVKTAIGRYFYFDPVDKKLKEAYGVNGETIIGKLLLGENLGIYSDNNSLTFDRNGLTITNGVNTFAVNPNSSTLLSLSSNSKQLLYATQDGDLVFAGRLFGESGTIGGWNISSNGISYATSSNLNQIVVRPIQSALTDGVIYIGTRASSSGSWNYPFRVNGDGSLIATNVDISGIVTATSGSIGDFTINNAIYNGKSNLNSTQNGVYIGKDGISLGANFQVTSDGSASFKDINITGKAYFGSDVNNPFSGTAVTHITNLVAGTVTADYVYSKAIAAGFITANTIQATYATIGSLNALSANVRTLEADMITASEVEAKTATIHGRLDAMEGHFTTLDAKNITTGTLSVERLNIDGIIDGIVPGLSGKTIQCINFTAQTIRGSVYQYYNGSTYDHMSLKTITIDGTTYRLLGV